MLLALAVVALSFALVCSEEELAFKRASVSVAETEAEPEVLALHATYGEDKDDSCWLDRFRNYNISYWKHEGNEGQKFLEHNFGSDVFSAVLMGVAFVVMFFGFRLFKPVVFIFGFFGGLFVCFFAIDYFLEVAKSTNATVNCWVLGVGALVGGLMVGCVLLKCLKLAMFCLGAAIGAVLGYYSWGIVFYRLTIDVENIAGHNLTYWLCLIVPAVVFGVILCRFEKQLIILATSICGAFAFTLGFDMLVLVRIDPRFMLDRLDDVRRGDDSELPFFIGVVAGAVVLTLISMAVQFKLNKKHQDRQDRTLMQFGHRGGIYADDMA